MENKKIIWSDYHSYGTPEEIASEHDREHAELNAIAEKFNIIIPEVWELVKTKLNDSDDEEIIVGLFNRKQVTIGDIIVETAGIKNDISIVDGDLILTEWFNDSSFTTIFRKKKSETKELDYETRQKICEMPDNDIVKFMDQNTEAIGELIEEVL